MTNVPPAMQAFLDRALPVLQADARLVSVAVGGSWLRDELDEYSDLDLRIVVDPAAVEAVMADREAIAHRLGPLLASFIGTHVGEPRLLICLYGPPLLHVDLKFESLDDAADRVETPAILWERDGALSAVYATKPALYPQPDAQWIEDRFWVWVHYLAAHLGRGELYEVIDGLTFVRGVVLGPLIAVAEGRQPRGVRRLEQTAGVNGVLLAATHPTLEARACADSIEATIALYVRLSDALVTPALTRRSDAEREAVAYLAVIRARLPLE
jgi:predicted nucleotidyltransferase